jgi:hypothetical protein
MAGATKTDTIHSVGTSMTIENDQHINQINNYDFGLTDHISFSDSVNSYHSRYEFSGEGEGDGRVISFYNTHAESGMSGFIEHQELGGISILSISVYTSIESGSPGNTIIVSGVNSDIVVFHENSDDGLLI